MSSPHSAGSAALLKSLNPDWSPAEIKSALMMTARTSFDEVGGIADPDIAGSGTIDLSRAALAGLVLDENFDNFLAANPATGGDPSTLNLASMRSNACNGTCSWTRTVCSTLDTEESWETNGGSSPGWIIDFTPSEFTLAPRGSLLKGGFEDEGASSSCQTIQIEATVTDQQIVDDGVFVFDALVLNPVSGPYPNMTLTISILPTAVAP